MKKRKIYLDTSVISFYYAQDSKDFMEITRDFFDKYSLEYELYVSDIVFLEISKNTNQELKNKMLTITNGYKIQKLETNDEIHEIAKEYIRNGIIPEKKIEDALHVAFVTYYEIDILLSWNFKHLANVNKESKILIENAKMNYRYPLRLLSPLEVIHENE